MTDFEERCLISVDQEKVVAADLLFIVGLCVFICITAWFTSIVDSRQWHCRCASLETGVPEQGINNPLWQQSLGEMMMIAKAVIYLVSLTPSKCLQTIFPRLT